MAFCLAGPSGRLTPRPPRPLPEWPRYGAAARPGQRVLIPVSPWFPPPLHPGAASLSSELQSYRARPPATRGPASRPLPGGSGSASLPVLLGDAGSKQRRRSGLEEDGEGLVLPPGQVRSSGSRVKNPFVFPRKGKTQRGLRKRKKKGGEKMGFGGSRVFSSLLSHLAPGTRRAPGAAPGAPKRSPHGGARRKAGDRGVARTFPSPPPLGPVASCS